MSAPVYVPPDQTPGDRDREEWISADRALTAYEEDLAWPELPHPSELVEP